jgi:hypothetical protein
MMRFTEIPSEAFTEPPTTIPQKIVYDWNALHLTIIEKGFVVIDSNEIRVLPSGAEECVLVKSFNSHLRLTKGIPLRTKRIGATRWSCTL